ncbi:hypothetical protein GCM10010277_13390 [Streptomyces longisporoflavus]|uniref:hypothetical protein n=1 Tax=Streptomyces longisporoflavus TaxID=28044 RepID=UPI00167D272B|nr:hypothetical protein [Streptomyces longisporoflavus]GGV30086.1 hypothetical protein GCM10010277_13390 [Streptomyces longisporoflavus]
MMYDQARAQLPPDKLRGSTERRAPGPDPLVPSDERDQIALRLQEALNNFPHRPVESLEEAESTFDEAAAQLMSALAEQRRALREGWQGRDPETQSDELRHAMRQYREITQRLLRA